MKKFLLIIIFLCIPFLSGCWDKTELQDLGIITAAAIDQVEEGKTMVSVQLFIPRAIRSGETGEDPSTVFTFVREGVGDNLADAVSKLQFNVPRKLFWQHCKIYIFGEELAKNGIRDEIDFLARSPNPRGNSYFFVSEGKAAELLKVVPPLERYSGEALRKLVDYEESRATTLRNIDMGFMSEGESVTMPLVKKLISREPARESFQTIPIISGTGIFKKDRLVGTLTIEESRGLMWLKDNVTMSTVSVKPEGVEGDVVLTPTLGRVKFSPEIKGDRWIYHVMINIKGDIIQNETKLNLMNLDTLIQIQNGYQQVLKGRVMRAAELLQKKYKTDAFNMGKRFHHKYPKEWKKVQDHWDEKFQEVEIIVNVEAKIRKPGFVGPPAALPKDEVKK